MSGLLDTVSGLLAVMNEHRQIISLNDSFIKMLGIEDTQSALGLRLGEALDCEHAHDEPSGCGTTRFCSTCGAAVAMVSSLGENKPVERLCALTTGQNGNQSDRSLLVRSQPIDIDHRRFLLLFIQDVTPQQKRFALERTFFHDINNMLAMLLGSSELLMDQNHSDLVQTIHQTVLRLTKEVAIQRSLSNGEIQSYQTRLQNFSIKDIMVDLSQFFENHPAAQDKNILLPENIPTFTINTDISLLLRILSNMVINALESSTGDDPVKINVSKNKTFFNFHVWNRQYIPEKIHCRIFQRNFSTKQEPGRGTGTFSMKLFGENVLGGKVSFTSSVENGTEFTYAAPIKT